MSLKSIPTHFQKDVLIELETERTESDRNKINVAINAKVMKLSHRMLNVCKRLSQSTEKEIVFHFFLGEAGIYDDGIQAFKLEKEIPNCVVYPATNYFRLHEKFKPL